MLFLFQVFNCKYKIVIQKIFETQFTKRRPLQNLKKRWNLQTRKTLENIWKIKENILEYLRKEKSSD